MKTKNIILGLALIASGLMVDAQNAGPVKPLNKNNQKGIAFVDNNKDGICDNYGSRKGFRGNGQGAGNGQGLRMRNGQGKGNANCLALGRGQGKGNPQGRNFIDANNNGVCDRFENTPQNK